METHSPDPISGRNEFRLLIQTSKKEASENRKGGPRCSKSVAMLIRHTLTVNKFMHEILCHKMREGAIATAKLCL